MTANAMRTSVQDLAAPRASCESAPDGARVKRVVTDNYGFLWRSLRRLGVPEADVDDGAQRVLTVFVRRIESVAIASERSFLFQTAVRVAADMRRSQRRSRVSFEEIDESVVDPRQTPPDRTFEQNEARALLNEALTELDLDLCAVFVLFELEEMTTAEISNVLQIPPGTVSSRLKRAREEFKTIVVRLEARQARRTR
jgi:RNA polymerase sigma-70 factor (ECF subfamily)